MSDTTLYYKYVPVDESFDKKGSLSIIKDGIMKFSSPKDFNDPFDCYPEFDEKAFYNSLFKEKPVSCEEKQRMNQIIEQEKGKLSFRFENSEVSLLNYVDYH